eukprot:TRINITY_DN1413_c0_g3_i4.p1 TRINITY_DN1413_c0_g3~~TRINITY_DN1413_c0_g3_i4.p1  ORF type:complete len:104 (+),score=5.57 TRINITY_DN1413_c0_g3_i4:188-499(+)
MVDVNKALGSLAMRVSYDEVNSIISQLARLNFPRISKWLNLKGDKIHQPPTYVTKLKSGITVVTNDYFDVSNQTANLKVGLYLKRGVVDETKENAGAFRLLSY